MLLEVSVSQPSAGVQSSKWPVQLAIVHSDFTQADTAFVAMQALPQPPQLPASLVVSVSQPLFAPWSGAFSSQFLKPGSHETTAQLP